MANRAISLTAFSIVLCFVTHASSQIHVIELTKKYFTDVSMICDHTDLNIIQRSDIKSIAWILPDGSTADTSRRPDPKLLRLSGPNDHFGAYNLTVLNIDDPAFGYYICVVVYTSESKPFSVIKWGLNVNGADFSELIKTYEENAIIGGIAAGAMLVVLTAGCLLWHFRYSNRHMQLKPLLDDKTSDDALNAERRSGYFNNSLNLGSEMVEIKDTVGSSVKT